MKIFTHVMESSMAEQVDTELRFVIASARANGNELLHLKLDCEEDSKIALTLHKQLKTMKREGKIDFFADKEAFSTQNAQASYLINKFPKVTESIDSAIFFFIIKL